MDIRALRYFLAVAREGTITRAAESLHIAQPSLSKQIMELERELGKTLLVRGKRSISLTDDGMLLRKRSEEILSLLQKTEKELMSQDTQNISGVIAIGGNPVASVLNAASALREAHKNIQFQFYSNDETEVSERLMHGSLDFAVFLEPIDTLKYDFVSLPDASLWGLLMRKDCALAAKSGVTKEDLRAVPLIFHRRAGLQRAIALWAQTTPENLPIAATYNVLNGSPVPFVKSGLGFFLTTRDLLDSELDRNLCFRPLDPPLSIRYALVWKRYPVFSRAAQKFIETVRGRVVADL